MSRLTELEDKYDTQELIFPCDCGNGDYLRITWDKDPDWRVLWIEAWGNKITLRNRIKGAWRILRDQSWQHTEILLDDQTVKKLVDFLSDVKE